VKRSPVGVHVEVENSGGRNGAPLGQRPFLFIEYLKPGWANQTGLGLVADLAATFSSPNAPSPKREGGMGGTVAVVGSVGSLPHAHITTLRCGLR